MARTQEMHPDSMLVDSGPGPVSSWRSACPIYLPQILDTRVPLSQGQHIHAAFPRTIMSARSGGNHVLLGADKGGLCEVR